MINFPAWVLDASPVPPAYLVGLKKLGYVMAAREYARRLKGAAYMWYRGATETVPDPQRGVVLTATDIALLQDAFPTQWSVYPGEWPVPPDKQTVDDYAANVWEPRQDEAQSSGSDLRIAAEVIDLTWVDWQGLI
jgi:hypothetical protein